MYFNSFACLWGSICRTFLQIGMPGLCFVTSLRPCVAQGCSKGKIRELSARPRRPFGPQSELFFRHFRSKVCFLKKFLHNVPPERVWVFSCRFFSVSLVSQHLKMWSNHSRVVQKQGWGKYHKEATWHQLEAPNVTTWTHFGIILASDSAKRLENARSRKTCFLGEGQNACPGGYDSSRPITGCEASPARWSLWWRKLMAGNKQHTI